MAAPGVAPLVAAECEALGLMPTAVTPAGVTLQLPPRDLFRLLCWTRCASRVLVRLATFPARDFATLEKRAARVPWGQVVAPGDRVALRVTCRKSRLYHSDAVAERVMRGIQGAVPGVVVDHAAADEDEDASEATTPQVIVVRFDRDVCTISADASGDLLHRRGWRQAVAKAPLRETLAAAMLAAIGWDGTVPLVDPFCGSGTIGIEAALRARRIAPGLARRFAMERWPKADASLFASVRAEARQAMRPSVGVPIVLRDRDAGAMDAARANAERAGVLADLDLAVAPVSALELAALGPSGVVLTNPPYGQRVSGGADLRPLFQWLGTVVREGGAGWQLGLLMPPEPQLPGQTGLGFTSRFATSNGGIPVALLVSQTRR